MSKVEDYADVERALRDYHHYSLFKPGKSYRWIQLDRMLKIRRIFNG